MNRLDQRHQGARVDLDRSVVEDASDQPARRYLISPAAKFYAAILGFVCCSAVVIVSAGILALYA